MGRVNDLLQQEKLLIASALRRATEQLTGVVSLQESQTLQALLDIQETIRRIEEL